MPVYSADKENALLALIENSEKDKSEGGGKSAAWASTGSKPAARVRGSSEVDGVELDHQISGHASAESAAAAPHVAPMVRCRSLFLILEVFY